VTPYARAAGHARWMLAVLALMILLVAASEVVFGHSSLAFAAAIIALIAANRRMLNHNCPNCGKNLFFRGALVVLWPSRRCTACGHDCDQPGPPHPQIR
jgi:predicted RNA-binding Zn-ribbon protein involved in translation (DUF1610 family)